MTLTMTAPPAQMAVNEILVWEHLRLRLAEYNYPADSDLVAELIRAATDEAEEFMSRSLITRTYRLDLDAFSKVIILPRPPAISVEEIAYVDTDGATQTLDPENYTFASGSRWESRILPAPGKSWPATLDYPGAVTVTFKAGYGNSFASIPAAIRLAILETVATRYTMRTEAVVGVSVTTVPAGARQIFDAYRSWVF